MPGAVGRHQAGAGPAEGHQDRADSLVEACVEVATLGGRAVVDGAKPPSGGRGLAAGDLADLVVVPGDTVTAAVMDRLPRSLVIHAGQVVARDGELV